MGLGQALALLPLGHSSPCHQVLLVVCPSEAQALQSSERVESSHSTSPQAQKQLIVSKPHCLACLWLATSLKSSCQERP